MVHEGEAERKDYYGIIRESLNKNVSIIEMFTMGNLNTVVKREDFDVSLDEEEDILTIQFKNDKQLYQSLYVYRVIVKAEGYNNSYVDVILYFNSPDIKTEWQQEGDRNWLRNISKITLIDKQLNNYEVRNINLKEEDDKKNDYDGSYKTNPNKYYSLDIDKLTLRIESKYIHRTESWSIEFEAKGYENSEADFYVNDGDRDPFGRLKVPQLKAEFLTKGDYSLRLTAPDDSMHSILRVYERRGVVYAPDVIFYNLTDNTVRELEVGEDEDFYGDYEGGGYYIDIFAKNFESGKEYRIVLQSYWSPSAVVKVTSPDKMPELKKEEIKVDNITFGSPIVIESTREYIENVTSVVITDERGFDIRLTEDHFYINDGALSLGFKTAINNEELKRHYGSFSIEVEARGYQKQVKKFVVKLSNVEGKVYPQPTEGRIEIGFTSDNSPAYSYPDTVEGVMSSIYIQDRLLLDGENTVIISSSRYTDIELKFEYNNEKLREEKAELLASLAERSLAERLSQEEVQNFKDRVDDAKTLRELRTAGIDIKVAILGLEKQAQTLKNEYIKQIEGSQLDKASKEELKKEVLGLSKLDELKDFEDKLTARIEQLVDENTLKKAKEEIREAIEASSLSAALKEALKTELEKTTKETVETFATKVKQAIAEDVQNKLDEKLSKERDRDGSTKHTNSGGSSYYEYTGLASSNNKTSTGDKKEGTVGKTDKEEKIEEDETPKSALTPKELPFKDLKDLKDSKAFASIAYVFERGIMRGTAADTFSPELKLNRATIVMILYNIAGEKPKAKHTFQDVKAGMWYEDAISWASENKIVQGRGDGKFYPEDLINRQELATILQNYAIYKGYTVTKTDKAKSYADYEATPNWARDAISFAVDMGLLPFDTEGKELKARAEITREDATVFIHRFLEKLEEK